MEAERHREGEGGRGRQYSIFNIQVGSRTAVNHRGPRRGTERGGGGGGRKPKAEGGRLKGGEVRRSEVRGPGRQGEGGAIIFNIQYSRFNFQVNSLLNHGGPRRGHPPSPTSVAEAVEVKRLWWTSREGKDYEKREWHERLGKKKGWPFLIPFRDLGFGLVNFGAFRS